MQTQNFREIPYNYTSADDAQIVNLMLGKDVWEALEKLRVQRVTGRSARLLMRIIGDVFVLRRNPFIYQEMIESVRRRRVFLKTVRRDLKVVEEAAGNDDVIKVINACRLQVDAMAKELGSATKLRRKIRKALAPVVGADNIFFDPFSLVAHATDATDWRLFLPLAVIRPFESTQLAPALKEIGGLGLHAIPRGAGTGLTGGAVPVRENCVVINTEKLNNIHGVRMETFTGDDGQTTEMPVLSMDAGVVTDTAMSYASARDLVFATDPTSAWACTIGGNIAENAGGKTAVLWGTAIDNLISYTIAMPNGVEWKVRRTDHRIRKIDHTDTVHFEVRDTDGRPVRTVTLNGDDIRKEGLWKDITNKALNGLPGVQKEGTDGIITSAEFILYRAYEYKSTSCLEFFGDDMDEASKVIVALSEAFVNKGEEALMALEHFDDEYIKAINYKVKAPVSKSPKAVLLIDMVGHTQEQIDRGTQTIHDLLSPYKNTEVFFAKDKSEAERFWQDRKRLGAISKRTNAFKLNEDIVLPLPALADFANFVDAYNLEEDRCNQGAFVQELMIYLGDAVPVEDPDWMEAKRPAAKDRCEVAAADIQDAPADEIRDGVHAEALLNDLLELFRGYKRLSKELNEIYKSVRDRRIVLATHMHAGDGNVHVNIPVFSNDREMMARANKAADDVMAKAVALGGVVSGEHGIGITKMKYFDSDRIKALDEYRQTVDPTGIMNPGKLSDPDVPNQVFTPSFNLLELEARILKHGSLETLANHVATCIRCGKCKPACCTFVPGKNMFYHPRNKNLAIGSLIEAILYDSQRWHSARFKVLRHLEEIADHCTICHKCFTPCPVDIDTGEVSILEREILSALKFKHTPLRTQLVLSYLKSRSGVYNSLFRKTVIGWGSSAQRWAHRVSTKVNLPKNIADLRVAQLVKSPMPKTPKGTLRDLLPPALDSQAMVINTRSTNAKAVFYFPGCGSERLFSQVSKASIYILLKSGVRVVIPPPYLCCGFPAKVNAKSLQHAHVSLRDTIIFSQIREMLGYLTFDGCVVSCGTCKESLAELDTGALFGGTIKDVSRYALEAGLKVPGTETMLYHAPCHDSMEGKAIDVMSRKTGYRITSTDFCCSEAGTMSMSRPDITGAMLDKKRGIIQETMTEQDMPEAVVLTNCPSCLQGLGRNASIGVTPRHIAEELAIKVGGADWEQELKAMVKSAETVNF